MCLENDLRNGQTVSSSITTMLHVTRFWYGNFYRIKIQWKPLIMITLGLALFNNNNRLITLSRGYKNLHSLTQFIVTVQHFTCIKTTKFILKTYVLLPVACLQLVVPE